MNTVKIYDFTLAANGMQDVPVDGEYFRVISSTGAINVRLDTGDVVGPILQGQGFKNKKFHRLIIQDASGAANVGTIICANADFVDDRITGEVSIIDGGVARSRANQAFHGTFSTSPVTATNNAQLMLWNTSTTKSLVVEQVTAFANLANGIFFVGLATVDVGSIASMNFFSKQAGGANSAIAQVHYTEGTGAAWVNYVAALALAKPTAGDSATFRPAEPWIVKPGTGLFVRDNLTATHLLYGSFEFFEATL